MSDAQRTRVDAEDVVPPIVYLALIGYLIGSFLFIAISRAIQAGYALCAATAITLPIVLWLRGRRPPRRVLQVAAVAVGISLLYLMPAAILAEGRTVLHVAIDLSTTIVPIGFLLAGSVVPKLFQRMLDPSWVLLFALTMLYAPVIVQDPSSTRLFEPPEVGVIALVTTLAVMSPAGRHRTAAGVGVALLAAMALLSGSRSVVVAAGLALAVGVITNRTVRLLAAAAVAAVALMLLVDTADAPWRDARGGGILRSTARIAGLIRPADDEAMGMRAKEAGLILREMGQRSAAWIPLGVGHGAVFEPEPPFPERNISAEGYVHNIHFGPLLMLFRYGVMGLGLYLALAVHAVIVTVRTLRRRGSRSASPELFFFAFGTSLYLVESLARNVLPNPVFSFVLAGHLALTLGVNERSDGVLATPPHDEAEHDPATAVANG